MAKEGFRIAREGPLPQFFQYLRKAQEPTFRSADHHEGVRSFLENRPVDVTGR